MTAGQPHRVLARGSLYSSYAVTLLYTAWALVIVGFQAGVLTDTPAVQRAAFLAVVGYWPSLAIFGGAALLLLVARPRRLRYVAAFAASVPPFYQLTIYVGYPLAYPPLTVNYLGLVLWAWMLPMVVLLVHWEYERLEWIAAGAGDPVLVIQSDPGQRPHPSEPASDDASIRQAEEGTA